MEGAPCSPDPSSASPSPRWLCFLPWPAPRARRHRRVRRARRVSSAFEALTGGTSSSTPMAPEAGRSRPRASNPEWSPDGSRLLYELDYGFGGLWSARSDGTEPRLIIASDVTGTARGPCNTEFGASDGAWSPSGRRVAFVGYIRRRERAFGASDCGAALDGSRVRMLGLGTEPDWIRDGSRIAFIAAARSPRSFSSRIATMRRDGSDVRMLLGDAKGYRSELDVSPDGSRLAFLESRAGTGFQPSRLRILHLGTGRTSTIPLTRTGSIGALAWMPRYADRVLHDRPYDGPDSAERGVHHPSRRNRQKAAVHASLRAAPRALGGSAVVAGSTVMSRAGEIFESPTPAATVRPPPGTPAQAPGGR